jgi:hypothetical protein
MWRAAMPYVPEMLDVENDHCKTVYAHFGLAAYYAQCFETSLGLFFLVERKLNHTKMTAHEFDALELVFQKKTLGALIKSFREQVSVGNEYEAVLDNALDRRNFLTHHFFRARAEYWMSERGRQKMLDELAEITDDLRKADGVIIAMYMAMTKALGITDQILEEEWDKLVADANSLDY